MRVLPAFAFSPSAAVLAAVLAACASARGAGGPAEPAADARAARLYAAKCGACHRLHEPPSRTREEWADAVARMAERAHLRDDERAIIARYLQGRARDAAGAR